jgi:hypothetical protein
MRFTALLAAFALLLPVVAEGQGQQAQGQQRPTSQRQLLDYRNLSVQEPPANIRLTFHLIEADGFTNDDPEIAAVVTELRRIFRFRGYRLAFTSVLNASPEERYGGRGGVPVPLNRAEAHVSQRITDQQGRPYVVAAAITVVDGDVRASVVLQDDSAERRGAELISASVNLTSGKTVVLGSTRTDATSGALILAVTSVFDP